MLKPRIFIYKMPLCIHLMQQAIYKTYKCKAKSLFKFNSTLCPNERIMNIGYTCMEKSDVIWYVTVELHDDAHPIHIQSIFWKLFSGRKTKMKIHGAHIIWHAMTIIIIISDGMPATLAFTFILTATYSHRKFCKSRHSLTK